MMMKKMMNKQTTTMRTTEEIIKRSRKKESIDYFGVQRTELFSLLTFEQAKPYLNGTFITMIEKSVVPVDQKWVCDKNVKKKIKSLMPFAYNVARAKKAISAERNLLHYKIWVWYDDPEFYDSMESAFKECNDYGIEIYDAIISHYGLKTPRSLPFSLIDTVKTSPEEIA